MRPFFRLNVLRAMISFFAGLCLTGCDVDRSTYANLCARKDHAAMDKALKALQRNTKLDQSAKKRLGQSYETRKEAVRADCHCKSRGLSTILTPEEFEEMIDEMVEKKSTSTWSRGTYLKRIGKFEGDKSSYKFIETSCSDYVVSRFYNEEDVSPPF